MTILGVVVRTKPGDVAATESRLRDLPGVDLAQRAGAADGRMVLVIEDAAETSAAATLAGIAMWPQVLSTSLVYEYSGPDSPSPEARVEDYRAWRSSLADLARDGKPPD
jgi:nitrate reductase NapD